MGGSQRVEGRSMLIAAAAFALVALAVFLIVWKWPLFFSMKETSAPTSSLVEEEKMQVLRQLEQSGAVDMSESEKDAALETLAESNQGGGAGLTAEQKLEILNSLSDDEI